MQRFYWEATTSLVQASLHPVQVRAMRESTTELVQAGIPPVLVRTIFKNTTGMVVML